MRSRWFRGRRNAHETADRQPMGLATGFDKTIGFFGQDSCLLGFAAGIDLDEQQRLPALPGNFLGQGLAQAWAVNCMDCVKKCDRLPGFVGLQGSDQMQRNVRMAVFEFRPFCLGFLDAILTENVLPLQNYGFDSTGIEGLRHGYECHGTRIAPCRPAGILDLTTHQDEAR